MSKYKHQLKALEAVREFPPYKQSGFVVEVDFNNSVRLTAGEREELNSHRLSKEDSEHILNIISMSIRERIKYAE